MPATLRYRISTTLNASSFHDSDSPVTWQAIVWVLLALAISSMAQQTGRCCGLPYPRRYRMYICISPIMCLADAISIICAVFWTHWLFNLSIWEAVRYVDFQRCRRAESERRDYIERPNPRSGLRWVVFILGTLPALLKLVCFSGLPWSKLWGLMFGVSYLLTEAVNMVATWTTEDLPTSAPAALGYSEARWDLDVNRAVREKADFLEDRLYQSGLLIHDLACVAQSILTIWTICDLSGHLDESGFRITAKVHGIVDAFSSVLLWIFAGRCTIFLLRYTTNRLRRIPTRSWLEAGSSTVMIGSFGFVLHFWNPIAEGESNERNALQLYETFYRVTFLIAVAGQATYGFLMFVSAKVPQVGRMLLVMKSRETPQDADQSMLGVEDLVDKAGLICATFFCSHLCLGVIWYATAYNPAGTTNSAWTSVFG